MGVRRARSAEQRSRLRGLVFLLMLLATVIAPLDATITLAGQAEDPPPIEQEEEQQADPPIEVETAEPNQPQPDTGTQPEEQQPDTGTQPQEEQPGQPVPDQPVPREPDAAIFSLQLVKRVCPAKDGFIPQQSDYPTLDDACQLEIADPASFFFAVTDATGELSVVNEVAPFFELPAGTTLAAEKHSGGYDDPIVFCSFGKGTQPERMEVVNRQVTIEPRPDILVTCEFFNPELPTAPEASLTVHKRICGDGYDIASEKADPMVDCTEPVAKVVFELADDDPTTPDQQQGTGAVIAGGVVFDGLAEGRYTVTESPPEGVTGAVVWACDGIGSEAAPPLSEGYVLPIDIPAGAEVVCYWFNLRGGSEPKPEDDGSITVVKWVCPRGYEPAARGADPLVDCTKPFDDVGFALIPVDRDVEARKGRTGDGGRGTVTFDGLPAGQYTLEENLPEGIANAFIWYCTEDPRQRQTPDAPLASGTRLTVDLAAGQDLWCHWYNVLAPDEPAEPPLPDPTDPPEPTAVPTEPVPTPVPPEPPLPTSGAENPVDDPDPNNPENNTVTVRKWTCPQGTEYGQSEAWYIERCTESMDGVEFRLTTAGEVQPSVTEGGVAVWTDLPMGGFGLRETIPAGYGAPVISCLSNVFPPIVYNPLDDGLVGFGVPDDRPFTFECDWYNIPLPDEPGDVDLPAPPEPPLPAPEPEKPESQSPAGNELGIAVFTCPGGLEASIGFAGLLDACAPYEGMGVGLLSEGGSSSRVSDAEGQAQWGAIPAGSWQMEQITPIDFGEPRVFCGPAGTTGPSAMPVTESVIQGEFSGEGERLACWWFNSPSLEPAGSGRVSLYMYACPAGTTYDAAADGWLENRTSGCDRAAGVDVTLSYGNATGTGQLQHTLTTDSNGRIFWDDGVPAAAWTLTHPPESGDGNPLVICGYVDPPQGVDGGWRVHTDVVGGVYNDAFAFEDMLAECHWFSIPTVDPGGANRVDLTVYDCPTGTTADTIVAGWPAGGAGDCTRAAGIEVILSYADASGVGNIHRPLVTDEDGEVFWSDGVPTAPWSLSQAMEPGYGNSLVICRYDEVPGAATVWRINPDVEDGTFVSTFAGVYDHPPEQQADLLDRCHWFNIPLPGEPGDMDLPTPTEPPVPTPEPEAPPEPTAAIAAPGDPTGSITVVKATCPAGFDIDRDGADPMRACTRLTDGISFSLLPAGDASAGGQRGRTGDNGRGALAFDGLSAGSYDIVEAASAGSSEAFVWYCTDDPRARQSPEAPLSRGTTLTMELAGGEDLYCLWFNVAESGEGAVVIPTPVQAVPAIPIPPDDPDADDPVAAVPDVADGVVPSLPVVPGGPQLDLPIVGEIRLSAFACGADVEVLSYVPSSGYYRAECTQPLSVEFEVGEHQDSFTAFTSQATDASGNSTFRPVDLGDVIIRQDSVSGYAMPQVFCRNPNSPTASWTYMPIDWGWTGYYDHSIWETLDAENPTLECEWYNMPLSDLDWERRIGITRYYCLDPDMSQPLAGQCVADVHHSFTFRVSTEVWDPEFKTVEWMSFLTAASPVRALTITQQLPDGFSPPVAQCRIVDYNQRWKPISDLGWLEADAQGGIAFEPIGINNALDCDWYSIVHSTGRSLTVYSHTCPSQVFTTHQACEVDGTVHRYELEYRVNDTWQHHSTVMTGNNGSYVWADMRPGTYRLVQDGGAWCHMTTDHPTGVGLIEVVSGQDTIMRVYTCAGGPGSGGGLPGQCVNISRLCPRS